VLPPLCSEAVNVTGVPVQIELPLFVAVTETPATEVAGVTVISTVSERTHPAIFDCTVYAVVEDGEATGFAILLKFRPVEGVQE
jgi:hypothetical protein